MVSASHLVNFINKQIMWLICQEIIHHPGLARTTPSAKKCSLIDAVEMSSVTDKDNIIRDKEEIETIIHQLVKEGVLKFAYGFIQNNCGFHPIKALEFVPFDVLEEGWLIISGEEAFSPITSGDNEVSAMF